jgi:thiamine biosynthesis lipoprotein
MSNDAATRAVSISKADDCWRGQFQAMASPCEILCKTDNATEAERLATLAATEVWRIEDKFSRYQPDNIVAWINSAAGEPVAVDPETAQLVDFAATLFDISGGKFDITSGVLRRAWRFDGGSELPAQKAIDSILDLVGWEKLSWKQPTLELLAGMELDFGGIGKEYAVDRATTILRDATDASCLVNLGGDLAVSNKSDDGRPWTVGIEAINASKNIPKSLLKLQVGALATSGDARRFILCNGVRYGHILDSRTGWPVANAPRSITVAADTCTQAGMLSTLAMLEGERAEAFLDAQIVAYWCER